MTLNAEKPPKAAVFQKIGPSGAIRTLGPVNPNHVRYQLRYTRIFSFELLYHGQGENQSLFLSVVIYVVKAVFGPVLLPEKNRKRPCCKGFRALAVPIMDRQAYAPKASALPTALHPDTSNYYSR